MNKMIKEIALGKGGLLPWHVKEYTASFFYKFENVSANEMVFPEIEPDCHICLVTIRIHIESPFIRAGWKRPDGPLIAFPHHVWMRNENWYTLTFPHTPVYIPSIVRYKFHIEKSDPEAKVSVELYGGYSKMVRT